MNTLALIATTTAVGLVSVDQLELLQSAEKQALGDIAIYEQARCHQKIQLYDQFSIIDEDVTDCNEK